MKLALETIERFPAERRHLVQFFVDRDPELALQLAVTDLGERRDIGAYKTLAAALVANGLYAEASDAISQALSFGTRSPALLDLATAIAEANR